MTEITISKESFGRFISCFGKDVGDILIIADEDSISAAVAKSTHYIYRKIDCDVAKVGNIYISDLPKIKSYLSTIKSSEIEISQLEKGGTLHIKCDSSSLQVPSTTHIESYKQASLVQKAVHTSKLNMWQTWFDTPLTHHAKISGESLAPATGFAKVLGDKYSCKTEFDTDSAEFIIRGGNSTTGKMFVRAELTEIDAPSTAVRSAFDKWLPELLNNLPTGNFNLHTGDETILVLEQPETDFLMLVVDQEYEED